MALDTYYDETTGEYIPPDEPNEPPAGAPPPTQAGPDPAKRRQDIINGIIIPAYQEILGRAPNEAEMEDGYRAYESGGGDAFRSGLSARRGTPKPDFKWPEGGFGAPAPGFGSDYTAGTYTPPTFNEPFVGPTAESLNTDPGYQARMEAGQRGYERSAAAKGSLLSGGFVGRTLPRALGELASNEYDRAFGRAYDTYQQRYGQFSDAAARGAEAFRANETGKLNQFQTRYNSYRDLVGDRRNSELDRWQREMDLSRLGLDSATAGRPGG